MSTSLLRMYEGDLKSFVFEELFPNIRDKGSKRFGSNIRTADDEVYNDSGIIDHKYFIKNLFDKEADSKSNCDVLREVNVVKYYFNGKKDGRIFTLVKDIENGEMFIVDDKRLFYKEIKFYDDAFYQGQAESSFLKCYVLRKKSEIHENSVFKEKTGFKGYIKKIGDYIYRFLTL